MKNGIEVAHTRRPQSDKRPRPRSYQILWRRLLQLILALWLLPRQHIRLERQGRISCLSCIPGATGARAINMTVCISTKQIGIRVMLEPNNHKLAASRTLNDLNGGFITSSVCHNYGIMSGCDEGCPALLSGDCEVPADAIKCCDVNDTERAEIMSLY